MKKFALALVAASLFAVPAVAQNLLVNGGFDGDAVPPGGFTVYNAGQTIGGGGWTVVGSGANSGLNLHTSYTEPGVAFVAQAGPNAFDLTAAGNTGPADGVMQSVATLLGQVYNLSFWLGNADGNANYLLPSSLSLTVAGVSYGTFTNAAITPGTINWRQYMVSFAGTGNPTVIQFNNATPGADNYAGLDTVSLTAIPEPTTWAMMMLGFGAVGFALRQRRTVSRIRFA